VTDEVPSGVRCELCGEDTSHKKWVSLNRYALGDGDDSMMVQPETDRYEWRMAEDGAAATGVVLCFLGCLLTWIEGEMIENDIDHRGDDDKETEPS